MHRTLTLSLLCALSFSTLSAQQTDTVERYGLVEIRLTSDSAYDHPILDLQVDGLFLAPDGSRRRMGGFWDGGDRYLVRFAPDMTGSWSWETLCTDSMNTGLHGRSGSFEVIPYTGDDPYRLHGWPLAEPGNHYLTHADGTPYFYMGCTAWEMSWRSYGQETDVYFSDRRTKGYNAVQMVAMSHRQIQEFGVVNRNGDSTFIGRDQSMLNPEYFRYLDSLILKANDSGLIVTIVPLWGDLAWVQEGSAGHRFPFNRRDALSLGRYIAARFGGYNVIWIIGADARYHTSEQKEFWNDFGRLVDSVSGGNHLLTVHSAGWSASWHFFPTDQTPWIDFHTYHSSHLADNDFQWLPASEAWGLEPVRPFVNGEQVYEDIYNNFSPDSARIDRRYVRQAAWESFLSGALVGVVYGANSIWQWHNGNYAFEAHRPRVDVLEAIHFPGSTDATMVKRIVERFRWWELTPRPDLVLEKGENVYIPCAVVDSTALLYFFNKVGPAVVDLSALGDTLHTAWIDPVSGIETIGSSSWGDDRRALSVAPPDTNDWVLVVRGVAARDVIPPQPPPAPVTPDIDLILLAGSRDFLLELVTPSNGWCRVEVVDLLGRRVYRGTEEIVRGENRVSRSIVDPGAYFVTVVLSTDEGEEITRVFRVAVP